MHTETRHLEQIVLGLALKAAESEESTVDLTTEQGSVCASCKKHSAAHQFEAMVGHGTSPICDCCLRAVWQETLENVTQCLKNLEVRCPTEP